MKRYLFNIMVEIFYLMKAVVRFISPLKHEEEKYVEVFSDQDNIKNEIPKIIWIYWDSKTPNYLVDYCIFVAKKNCPEYEFIILNNNNIEKYVELPKFHEDLEPAHKADYIRLELLSKYGGIWMDASIYLCENFDWIFSKLKQGQSFVFYSDQCTIDNNHPVTENWFIVSQKHNSFINDWLAEYKKCIFSDNPKKYYEYLNGDKIILQNLPNISYLMCYVSAAVVLSKKQYNILYVNSGAVGHFYNYYFFSNSFIIALALLFKGGEKVYVPKLIKFTSSTRTFSNFFIKYKLYRKKSLMGRYLKDFFESNVQNKL